MRARIPGIKTGRKLWRWLRSRVEPHVLVLGYHRIEAPAEDPYGICTSPAQFGEHMELLRREAQPISLAEMLVGLRTSCLPRRGAVVTLDDGYADSLYHAKPVLEALQVPATVFVTTGLLGRQPWWDALAGALSFASARGESLDLRAGGHTLHWDAEASQVDTDRRAERIREVQRCLLDWPTEARERAIEELGERFASARDAEAEPRGLEPDELRRLAEGPWIEIGAHSVSHPRLGALPEDAQRLEIEESKRSLEALVSTPIRAFSYPNGSYSERTRALVRECGFESACASFNDVVHGRSDPFSLPRFWVSELSADDFKAWLRRWC